MSEVEDQVMLPDEIVVRTPALTLEHVCYTLSAAEQPILEDVTCAVMPGEIVIVTGPSGSGKSTLLAIAAGLIPKFAGTVRIAADVLPEDVDERAGLRARHLGLVFQDVNLLPHLTLTENLRLARWAAGKPALNKADLLGSLDAVDLASHANKPAWTLSGGQRARAGLARALVADPNMLLADEPTGSLDDDAKVAVRSLVRDYVGRGGAAMIVTHDREFWSPEGRTFRLQSGRLEGHR